MLFAKKTKNLGSFVKNLILDAIIIKEESELVMFRLLALYIILKSRYTGPESSKIFNESMVSACKYVNLTDKDVIAIINKFNDYMDNFYMFVARNRETIMKSLCTYQAAEGQADIHKIINYYYKKLSSVH
jgi:hypothetical protein